MKNIALLFIMLCSLAHSQVYSQTRHKKRNAANLSITLSADYYSRLLDSTSLSKDSLHWKQSWVYNASERSIGYHFKNLSKGEYTFFARDIFGFRHSVTFRLAKDTVIKLDHHMGYHPVPVINKKELQSTTPVYIIYLSRGCFADFKGTAVLKREKTGNTYRLDYASNTEKQALFRSGINAAVLDDLVYLQTQSLAIKAADTTVGISTSSRNMLILAGDKLFYFGDKQKTFEWRLFGEFLNKYLNQEFKR